ncbi:MULTISPECIES: hypothetical protein [Cellulomonas]|uniref:Uncharacterized protein n=1 Tax=Cellulomonas gelida TaxID=1712 RepID=A0A4Y3KK84_9CELL|nr:MULTISPECIES: hypothetical protein [Cellulomonas]MCR6705661.1 hypothetical protein [Cellulomonas sp.]GEA84821.1 hypothetical protein CGE01nite_20720 [Cellulomonas gelida]GGL16140.1 hypothetical protein GCM10009774_03150 [Cellulomonas gelida]
MPDAEVVHWEASDATVVPRSAKTAEAIAGFANQLSERDRKQLIQAFDSDLLEMGSVFVWTRTMAGLKTQLAGLGIDFIAEMLDRPDIRPGAEVHEVLTDYEAVRLAEELGMFGSTLAMRLRQNLELVAHFSNRPADAVDDEMMPEEALSVLRTCVQTVLGREDLDIAVEFAAFRKRLEASILDDEAPEIEGLVHSAYFFKRTVLRLLLAGSKGLRSAQLENVLANLNTLLPPLWPDLKDPDRYMVGRAYAELHAEGHAIAANGLRSALLKVSGFDFVPEGFRSQAFLEAAAKLQSAHFGWDNFHNEVGPMHALASLGTSIPRPAFHRVVTAIILIRIGNHYGVSFAAQEPAMGMLRDVTADRWQYFFDGCLPVDDVLLMELQDAPIARRWCDMVGELPRIGDVKPADKRVRQLVDAARQGDAATVMRKASRLLEVMRTEPQKQRG